jgi:F-type H+-transporting ATPase subunit b
MPQISQAGAIYASQFFWLAVVFLLIYVGIGKAMVPRIEATIDDRRARIQGDLAAAEAARIAARAGDEAYKAELDRARATATKAVAEAKAAADAERTSKLKVSDATIEARLQEATARIEGAKRDALAGIEASTVEAVEAIVAKLSGATVDRAAAVQQVRQELAHG